MHKISILSPFFLLFVAIFVSSVLFTPTKITLALSWDTVFEVVPGLQPLGLLDGDLFGVEPGDIFGSGQSDSDTIKKAYQKCLEREPSAEEIKYHQDLISQKTARGFKKGGGASVEEIVVGICNSEEAKNKKEDGAEDQSPSETFLWKPKSDSDGKLVVLLPSSMRGQVVSVAVQKDGQTLDTGRFSGDTHNGMRPHFRFPKAGADYGKNIQVVSMGTTGACAWKIADGAKRTEGVKSECGATALNGGDISGFDINAYMNNITGGTFSGGSANSCTPYVTPRPGQIPDKIEGVSLISGKSSLTAYQEGYRASSWMMFHKGDSIKLRGTGYLLIAWESEAHHPNAPVSSIFTPPLMSGDITYVGDLRDDGKGNAHLPIGAPGMHAWPDGSDSRLRLFCIDGDATITSKENTGGTQWYNMMIDVVPPVCEPVKRIQTNFVPYNQNIVDRCAAKLKTASTTASTNNSQNTINTYLQSLLGGTTTNSTSTTNSISNSKTLAISCEISDTSIEVGEDTEISVDISGGKSPYKIRWSGDTSKIRKISKTKNDQDIEFKKAGKYVLEVKVTDDAGKEVEEICSAITVREKGAKEEVEINNSTVVTSNQSSSGSSSYPFYRDLTVGSEGSDVSALQDFLISNGYLVMPAGVAKGYFGNVTRDAVIKWQIARGISPAAGYFGTKSRAALSGSAVVSSSSNTTSQNTNNVNYSGICSTANQTAVLGESGQIVTDVQSFLVSKGFLVMPENTSYGYFGKLTATAIANYMAIKGVSTNGSYIDQNLLSEVKKDSNCR